MPNGTESLSDCQYECLRLIGMCRTRWTTRKTLGVNMCLYLELWLAVKEPSIHQSFSSRPFPTAVKLGMHKMTHLGGKRYSHPRVRGGVGMG